MGRILGCLWGVGGLEKGRNAPRGLQIHRDVNSLQAVHTPDLPTYLVKLPPCWHRSTHGFYTKIIVFSMF